MIYSMTGFGRARREVDGLGLEIEVRSVNHRHLDLRVRLPRILADQESALKKRIQTGLSRGKVDVIANLTMTDATPTIEIDQAIAAQYVEASNAMRERHSLGEPLDVASLLDLPGVTRVVEAEVDAEELIAPLSEAIDEALEAMVTMRAAEGESLAVLHEGRL
jgi:uncharacterized protein (TIGR00255 family)